MKTPIFGSYSVARSLNFADNRLMNLYPQISETKDGKAVGALYSTAGLSAALATLGVGPVRALHPTSHLGLFALSGGEFYKIDDDFTPHLVASGIVETGLATIIDNGVQVALFVGSAGFSWSPSTGWAGIALPFAPMAPISAAYQDGFGVINQPGTALWFQSDLLDLTAWNALNFGDASGDPDDIVVLAQINREIWLIKQNETEVWYNAGTPNFTFARLDGVYIEYGCAAQLSLARSSDSLIWLHRNVEGQGIVVQGHGHQVRRISTHSIETAIQRYSTISDAIGYTYQQSGHEYYVLSFPTGNETWVYDATESALAGVPMWHQRGAFSTTTGNFGRHWGNCHAFFAGKNVIGDYRNGNLYSFEPDALTDAGAVRKWLRSWRALPQPTNKPVRFSELQIDMQTGVNVPAGTIPVIVIRWSDDGGHTWSAEHYASAGADGETGIRVMFRRLGSTRRNSGLDRIFELSSTDQFPVALIGADLEAS